MKILLLIYLSFIFIFISIFTSFVIIPIWTFDKIDQLSFLSLFIFFIFLIYGLKNKDNFITALIFIFLAFPSNINNFLPGLYLGDKKELGAAIFPLITHIDIFIIFGILRFRLYLFKISRTSFLFFFFFILIFLSFLINLIISPSSYEFGLMIIGSYHFRFFLLIYLIVHSFEIDWFYRILEGLKLSVIFLAFESFIYTYINDYSFLTSGSLGVNSFGNILSSISLLFIILYLNNKNNSYLFWFLISFFIFLFTGTRISIIAFLISLIIYKFQIINFSFKKFIVTFSIFITLFFYLTPNKYNIFKLITPNIIENVFKGASNNDFKNVRTTDNSSVITRLFLYRTSLKMTSKNPILGIGAGKWNHQKYNYGFPINVLIDSHNGFLSLISQYGFLTGIFFFFYLLVKPSFFALKYYKKSIIFNLGFISLVMLFAEFSNSGIFKFQIFSFLIFISILLHKSYYDNLHL